MIGGAQPKVLLNLTEDGELVLDELFLSLFEKEVISHKYKLVRERDGLTKTSLDVMWLEFNEQGFYTSHYDKIAVSRSLIMSPFNSHFTWQTTPVTEIVEQRENYVKFRTKNSNYELYTL